MAGHLDLLRPDVIHAQHLDFGLSLAFGLVDVDAQAHGVPVIYSAVAGLPYRASMHSEFDLSGQVGQWG